jgi:DNA ligase-1
MLFSRLCCVFDRAEGTASRLAITDELSKLFLQTGRGQLRTVAYFCQGVIAPDFLGLEIGMGDRLAIAAIARISGAAEKKVGDEYRKLGDLGEAAQSLLSSRRQKSLGGGELTVEKVCNNFLRMAAASGAGSQEAKIRLLCELLSSAAGSESKTIVRFCTDNMRLGIGEPTIIDALSFAAAGDKSLRPEIERAFNLTSDLGLVAETVLSEKGMEKIRSMAPKVGNPIRPALAERLETAEEIFEKLGECAVEGKYDGFRVQVHKGKDGKVEFFSRRQERITYMFPELAEAVTKSVRAKEAIFEGEAVGTDPKTGRILPFQVTVQRKRKHDIENVRKRIPLRLYCFELLFLDGRDCTLAPYSQRRKKLEGTVANAENIAVSEIAIAKSPSQIESFVEKSVGEGLEGIIAKDLSAPYVAGARKFAWIKLKKSYSGSLSDTVDVAIVGFYYGKGKRAKFGFGGVLTAVFDSSGMKFKTVARVGSGFDEGQMAQFQEMLGKDVVPAKPANVDSLLEPDEWVKPRYVIEVNADEITKSPVHTAARDERAKEPTGLALRFPRFVRLRDDKVAKGATTVAEIFEMFEGQGNKTMKYSAGEK